MEKDACSSVRISGRERMNDDAGGKNGGSGMAVKCTSFILAWLLAIFFSFAFWYGVYLLLRAFIFTPSWEA